MSFFPDRVGKVVAMVAAGLLAAGCAEYNESGLPGSSASIARNQIMWVNEEAGTLGYRRLQRQSENYPDLVLFVGKHGSPDFMAETADRSRLYFILYYLEKRRAFACRTLAGGERSVEFSGPYPITDKEYETLDGFRKREGR
ncbi:MAG: hypothetical protein ACQCXQ_13470 [Verrucomicrobiales bacterium]|nr:hypothetical protein [Verrucomicrobiota bacterium JB025]